MKKIFKLLLLPLIFYSELSFSNDGPSYPPALLKNCTTEGGAVTCMFDDTFLYIATAGLSMNGDYQFSYAVGHPPQNINQPTLQDPWSISYYYVNTRDGTTIRLASGYYGVIEAGIKIPGNQWFRDPKADGNWACQHDVTNPNSDVCPFTHTPWTVVATVLSQTNSHDEKNIPVLKTKQIKFSQSSSTGNIIINNKTDYPVSVHQDDYNTAYLNLTAPTVPAHSINYVVGHYQMSDGLTLQFDTELGPGDRKLSNTTLFIAAESSFTWINYDLTMNGEKYTANPILPDGNGNITIEVAPYMGQKRSVQ